MASRKKLVLSKDSLGKIAATQTAATNARSGDAKTKSASRAPDTKQNTVQQVEISPTVKVRALPSSAKSQSAQSVAAAPHSTSSYENSSAVDTDPQPPSTRLSTSSPGLLNSVTCSYETHSPATPAADPAHLTISSPLSSTSCAPALPVSYETVAPACTPLSTSSTHTPLATSAANYECAVLRTDASLSLSAAAPLAVSSYYAETPLTERPHSSAGAEFDIATFREYSTSFAAAEVYSTVGNRHSPNVTKFTAAPETDAEPAPVSGHENVEIDLSQPLGMPAGTQTRHWTREFLGVFQLAPAQRAEQLKRLFSDFVATAKIICQLIIDKQPLPVARKTIRPISGKGVAGGEKYICCGMFIKYAIDVHGLYGGDDNAMKAAGHELKGLTSSISAGMVHGLNVPLMALIDYKGFRLVCTSLVPIYTHCFDTSLVYGSDNAGHAVHADDADVNDLMTRVAEVLNLKPHVVGPREGPLKTLMWPVDIEVHRGTDGNLYLLDTTRVFPPETPTKGLQCCYMFRLLRPELMRKLKKLNLALSSDAYSPFGWHNADVHNAEVDRATQYLRNDVITAFARELDGLSSNAAFSNVVVDGYRFAEQLHRAGINMRYLELLRQRVSTLATRRFLLEEMIARTIKHAVRRLMRSLAGQSQLAMHNALSKFLAMAFLPVESEHGPTSVDMETENLWENEFRRDLEIRFPSFSEPDSQNPHAVPRLRTAVDIEHVRDRVYALCGLEVVNGEVQQLLCHTKPLYIVGRIEADSIAQSAESDINNALLPTQRYDIFSVAVQRYEEVLRMKTDDELVLSNLGVVLGNMGLIQARDMDPPRLADARTLFHRAFTSFEQAISLNAEFGVAYYSYANALADAARHIANDSTEAVQLFTRAEECYRKAKELLPQEANQDALFNYAKMTYELSLLLAKQEVYDPQRSIELLRQSLELGNHCDQVSRKPLENCIPSVSLVKFRAGVVNHIACVHMEFAKRFRAADPTNPHITQSLDAAVNILQAFLLAIGNPDLSNSAETLYNLGCAYALMGMPEECREWMFCAKQAGTLPKASFVLADTDLESVRGEPWFKELLA